jgi:transcriptional regulator with XRE-family HTH domain
MTPGQRIKEERLARQWSQQKLADEIGKITKNKISRAAIALWEGGGSKTQKSENLLAAAQVLGLSPQWLLSGAGDKHQAYIAHSARDIGQAQPENHAPAITREQQQMLDLIGRMDKETGALFIKLFDRLVPDRRKKQAKERARARVTGYGIGESVRRGDLFVRDEPIGRTKSDGDTF